MEHLGQYVFEMSQAKVEAVKKGEGVVLVETDTAGISADISDDEDDNAGQIVEEPVYDGPLTPEDEIQALDKEAAEKSLDAYPQ